MNCLTGQRQRELKTNKWEWRIKGHKERDWDNETPAVNDDSRANCEQKQTDRRSKSHNMNRSSLKWAFVAASPKPTLTAFLSHLTLTPAAASPTWKLTKPVRRDFQLIKIYSPFLSNKNLLFFPLVFNKARLHFPLILHQAGFSLLNSRPRLSYELRLCITCTVWRTLCRPPRRAVPLTVVCVEDLSHQQQEPLLGQAAHVQPGLPDKRHPQLLLQVATFPRQLQVEWMNM